MNYPVWDLPFAHGLLIAVVAILHVYVSHFAVGGGLYLVVTEHMARRRGDAALLDVLHGHSRFFLLLTLVFGAISGVGIWFTIGLINPAGTSALIHAFVWGWAIEWTFFVTEIVAAMVYYYGWNRLSAGKHLAVGWIYFVAAWLSMVVINGILSFQLTPGAWLETRDFWDGFFNPTYWSSLFARTFFAVGLAGMFALLTGARLRDGDLRTRFVRLAGVWSILGLAGTVIFTRMWWHDVPEEVRALTGGDMPFASVVTHWTPLLALGVGLLVVLGPLLMPRLVRTPAAVVILLAGLGTMGAGEWVREAIRKPWVVHGYIYSNGILADEIGPLRGEGIAANAKWVEAERPAFGAQLFRASCQNCHSREGYNGIRERVRGWDQEFATQMIERIEYTRRQMPPWVGTRDEASALAEYILSLKQPGDDPPPGSMSGPEIFAMRCSPCHSIDGFRSMRERVEGLDVADLDEYLQFMESDYMPPFTGTEEEREALAEYLAAIAAGTEGELQLTARSTTAKMALQNEKRVRESEGTR